jgi:hypothetical protein
MIIISCSDIPQDSVKGRNIVLKDSIGLKSDSTSIADTLLLKDSLIHILNPAPKSVSLVFVDTTAVCKRNSVADITFYDSDNEILKIESGSSNRFPFIFIEKNKQMQTEARASLIKHLKPGQNIPVHPLHDDWIILIILIAAFFYSVIRTISKSMLPGVARFFLLRGINDPSSRDVGGLFHWQSTVLNLISFLIIGLFAYCAASYYDFIPSGIRGIIFWLISVSIIISAVTLRHIVCLTTGNASGEKEVFREYLLGVYQSYRFSALFLFVIIILMSYTVLLPERVYFISGIIVLGIMYLIRIIRLMIIFINRNISIFYLILYLCALEILPVVISVKYFTGLV